MDEAMAWHWAKTLYCSLLKLPEGWDERAVLRFDEQEYAHVLAVLRNFGRKEARREAVHGEELELLYALSRIVDVLIAPHQPVHSGWSSFWQSSHVAWLLPQLPAKRAWTGFCAGMGASLIAEEIFHPFFHEIVEVEQAEDPAEPPSLVAEHWPGALVGSLLLVRSGVTVRAGRNWLDPQSAASSTLHWAWYRRNRDTYDDSFGWGSQSQWRTAFRRDYVTGDEFWFNVDGEHSAEQIQGSALAALRHRCQTNGGQSHGSPHKLRHIEPRPGR